MTDSNQDPGPEKPGAAGDWMMTFAARERTFLVVLLGCFLVAALSYQSPMLAMWVGFAFAGYSAVANDSIQTIGTFIASNREQKWWVLWIFIGGIFALTVANSWWNYGSGVEASYFANVAAMESGDEPVHEETYPDTGIDWTRYEPLDVEPPYAVHFEGRYLPERSGEHTFGTLNCNGRLRLTLTPSDGEPYELDRWGATEPFADTQPITLVAGETYALSYDFAQFEGAEPTCVLGLVGEEDGEATVEPLDTTHLRWRDYGGDVSYGRLSSKGFERQPQRFSFLQVAAPLFLLILTRLRMPVSTTFLILTCFVSTASGFTKVLVKSMSGYAVAFACAMLLWLTLGRYMKKKFVGTPAAFWRPLQWITTGTLWSVWLQQDAANIAVYLPRNLNPGQFAGFALFIIAGLGLLFFQRGERIQQVVDEKSQVTDVRAATIIDLIYAFILWYFKIKSKVPMSTTWVFIGLLGGRELAMSLVKANEGATVKDALKLMGKDVAFVTFGLIVSIVLAVAINDVVREAWLGPLF